MGLNNFIFRVILFLKKNPKKKNIRDIKKKYNFNNTQYSLERMIKKLILWIKYILAKFASYIYDFCVTYPVTKAIYKHFATKIIAKDFPKAKNMSSPSKNGISFIDIGTGTGTPLKSILNQVNFKKILAIDIDKQYITIAQKKFKNNSNVEVKLQNLLTYHEDGNTEKFDVVFFGFSFMLMPDKKKALEVARKMLNPGGKIYTFLTLYHKKNKFMEFIKPKISKLTSIEFGEVLYYKQVI